MFKERLISGLFGSMFICVFQPFGLLAFGERRWVLILGISACVFGSILLVECLLTWVLRMPHDPSRGMKYLIKRNSIFQVLNILGMTFSTIFFLDRFCCMEGIDNHLSWGTFIYALLVYLASSLLIGLYWRNVYMKRDYQRQLEEAQYLNGILQERQRMEEQMHQRVASTMNEKTTPAINEKAEVGEESLSSAPVGELTLTGSTKESLTLLPQDFVYAEADGNYVHIHYLKEGVINESLLRCSISQIEETMSVENNILRCHRAFVVNLSHIVKLESHSSTLQLFFKESKTPVPVSKTYIQVIRERIVDPKK